MPTLHTTAANSNSCSSWKSRTQVTIECMSTSLVISESEVSGDQRWPSHLAAMALLAPFYGCAFGCGPSRVLPCGIRSSTSARARTEMSFRSSVEGPKLACICNEDVQNLSMPDRNISRRARRPCAASEPALRWWIRFPDRHPRSYHVRLSRRPTASAWTIGQEKRTQRSSRPRLGRRL